MKNLKILLITSFISLALLSYADNRPKQVKKITRIAIEQVNTVRGLPGAIYQQVNPAFLSIEHPGYYKAVIKHRGETYLVFGTRKAWLKFYSIIPVPRKVGKSEFRTPVKGNL
jgi:hypothetical protein